MLNTNNLSTINKITIIGLLSALGIVLNIIQIPYVVPFLKIDISEVVVLVAVGFGFWIGIGVGVFKALAIAILYPQDPIGNLTLLFGSIVIASSFYLLHKILKINTLFSLILTGLIFTILLTVANYFVITPLYSGESFATLQQNQGYLKGIILLYVPFNFLKITIVSVIYYFISRVIFSKEK